MWGPHISVVRTIPVVRCSLFVEGKVSCSVTVGSSPADVGSGVGKAITSVKTTHLGCNKKNFDYGQLAISSNFVIMNHTTPF